MTPVMDRTGGTKRASLGTVHIIPDRAAASNLGNYEWWAHGNRELALVRARNDAQWFERKQGQTVIGESVIGYAWCCECLTDTGHWEASVRYPGDAGARL